jgi:hypothetical protein
VSSEAFDIPRGDPDGLRAASRMLHHLAEDHASLKTSFKRHASIAEDGWTGGFATRFHACAEEISGRFDPACETAADAAVALSDYATVLEDARHGIAALNRQASDIETTHLDPAERAHAMSQLAGQADDITEQLDHAASMCASRLTWNEHNLTSLPGTTATGQLLADVRRATHRLAGKEPPSLWERTEPGRKVLEGFLAPFDLAAGDYWIDKLKELAGVPAEWSSEFGEEITKAKGIDDLAQRSERILALAYEADTIGQKTDAWFAFAPAWLRTAAESLAAVRGAGTAMSGLGILADIGTFVSPQDTGHLALADRGAATVNGLILAVGLAGIDLGPAGAVLLAGTGMYLAGDWLYHHWTPFRDVADDIGHAVVNNVTGVVHGYEKIGHGAEVAADDVGHAISNNVDGDVRAAEKLGRGVEEADHAARSAWHSVTSSIGSWF